jgi:beta-lactamase class D
MGGLGRALAGEAEEVRDFSAFFGKNAGEFVMFDGAKKLWVRHHPEGCGVRTSPCSTFKVLNSLIALETGVADGPDFPLKWDGKKRAIEAWNRDQTMRSAIAVSCVWYYEALAARIGMERYREILPKVGYGNNDVSAGLPNFWIESSLAISPDEQVRFLRRMQAGELPFARKNVETVLEIMTLSRVGKVTFRGKTGTAGTVEKATLGWFIGSVSSAAGECYFATRLTGGEEPSGKNARKVTEGILGSLGWLPEG